MTSKVAVTIWTVILVLLTSACGGNSDAATPATTATDISSTATRVATNVATTTADAPATTVAATDATTTTAAPTPTQASATTVSGLVELAAACLFDDSALEISCSATGVTQGSQLRWESNVAGWLTGPTYEVKLTEPHQLVAEVLVMLEECQGSDCVTVETRIDTSILVPSYGDSTPTPRIPATDTDATMTQTAPTVSAPNLGTGKSVSGKGFAELVDVEAGVAAWLSRDIVVKSVSLAAPGAPGIESDVTSLGFASGIFANDEYIYTSGSEGFAIMDIDDPLGSPLGTYDFRYSQTIVVDQGVAYLAAGDELLILDVHDPTSPVKLSRTTYVGTGPHSMVLADDLLFVPATIGGGLNIIDVSKPENPIPLTLVPFESHSVGLKVQGSYAYLARVSGFASNLDAAHGFDASSALDVIDISDPMHPEIVSSISLHTDIRDIFIIGTWLYAVGTFTDEFLIIDIASPTAPVVLERPTEDFSGSNFRGAYQYNDYAYLLDSGSGVWVVDLTNPLKPTVVTKLSLQMTLGCLYGNGAVVYICGEEKYFQFADVSDPNNPVLSYSGKMASGSFPYTSVVVSDGMVYAREERILDGVEYPSQFGLYEVSDPSKPQWNPVNIGVDSIAVSENYVFTTIGEIGLDVYDISDFDNPQHVSRTEFPIGMPRNGSLSGDWFVGVSNIPYSITLINVADPYNPVVTDTHEFTNYPHSVTVSGDHVYVAHGQGTRGVDIFGIGAEGQLTLAANIPGETELSTSYSVTVASDKAYVISGGDAISIFDVTDPTQPIPLGRLRSYGMAAQAKVLDGYIYVADGYSGLTVLKLDTN